MTPDRPAENNASDGAVELVDLGGGVWSAPGARLIDRCGRKCLPKGYDGWANAMEVGTIVDKTMLAADVVDSTYAVTLFCRPRRFGKSLNMTMLREFFELRPDGKSSAEFFEGTEIWDVDEGYYQKHQGAYPLIQMSFNTVKKLDLQASLGEIKRLITTEYIRHDYLKESLWLTSEERDFAALYSIAFCGERVALVCERID